MLTATDRDLLINNNLQFAKTLARIKRKSCKIASLEELEAAAYFGLVQAAKSFDPAKSPDFRGFASRRIFGAMSDYLIEISPGTKSKRMKSSLLPDSLEARPEASGKTEVFDVIIAPLPQRTQVILRRAFIHEDTLTQRSKVVGLHESRISQIITEARNTLRGIWFDRQYKLWDTIA